MDEVATTGSRKRPTPPDFLIIGAQKAGTTSLHGLLRQVPGLFLPAHKEPSFYCGPGDGSWTGWTDPRSRDVYREFLLDPDAYEALFADSTDQLRGDASTMYLVDPNVPGRVTAANPDIKIIALLREPAARAYSSWKMWRRAGLEPLSFRDALDAEPERARAHRGPAMAYVATGRYASHLERWGAFVPSAHTHVILTDDLAHDPEGVVARIVAFLGLSVTSIPPLDTDRRNVGDTAPRSFRLNAFVRHSRVATAARRWLPDPIRHRVGAALADANAEPRPAPIDPVLATRIRRELVAETETLEERYGWDLSSWKDN